ncbi:MAG TPA: hypothetical protein VHE30_15050 [Polyangiaceae bacterium]|nr:hypothetical protein [Polyangiaceae bacterium]
MSDEPRPAEPAPPPAPASGRRAILGAVFVSALAFGVSFAVVRARAVARDRETRLAAALLLSRERENAEAAKASAALASLASALGSLGAAKQKVEGPPPPIPPSPEDFPSPTACMRTYLPNVDVKDASLGFVCDEVDAWKIERELYLRLAHRRGGGAWTDLGSHALAALAILRNGCCPAPAPMSAVVAGLWCGTLKEDLRALGPAPTDDELRPHEKRMRCLTRRGMHFPDRFSSVPEEKSMAAFSAFLAVARRRSK